MIYFYKVQEQQYITNKTLALGIAPIRGEVCVLLEDCGDDEDSDAAEGEAETRTTNVDFYSLKGNHL